MNSYTKPIVDPEPPGTSAGIRWHRYFDDARVDLGGRLKVVIAVIVAAAVGLMIYLKW